MAAAHRYHKTAWLWWLAFLFITIGGSITYLFSLQTLDPQAKANMSKALAVTIIGAGTCIICATANWWLKR